MRYHIVHPTAPIFTGYTLLLFLYPLQVYKIISLEVAQKNKFNLKFSVQNKGKNWNTKTPKHPNRKYRKSKIFMRAHPPSPNCCLLYTSDAADE